MVKLKDRVRFVETDMMGVVHHANYFRWFEMGRVEYLRQAGVDLLELMEADYIFPITDARCSYKKPATFADEIIICADMIELSRVKMVFSYKIKNAKDESLIAEGLTQNVFTKKDGAVARLPKEFYQRLRIFFEIDTKGGRV